ncbi:bile acid:sodium symporter family protein [Teredinibacter sp. KSP-S5-2]|uniref:bile acid:sodium symporter family protein n=1 Tax=Teredinibacter sp. KSP-S5-2 TaxID=3034506 RepID=UPI002934D502|nr:bile acid:sodium symporter family protein [Teredinibacter sp. KSP-S5-2]WNO08509.1 bile acid:sodium symporter family protein [Teredinibacter sp. KSP-S5-2]
MESTSILSAIAPLILALMMLGLGLSLTFKDFQQLSQSPKAVITGTLLQIIGLPIIGFSLTQLFNMPAELAVGLMVLVACPGGPGSNLVSFLCRGDTALSISLTAISSVLAIVTIPLVTSLSYRYFMGADLAQFSVSKFSFAVLCITLIPILIGILIRHKSSKIAELAEKPVKIGSILFLLLLVGSTFYKERANLPLLIGQSGLPVILLAIVTVLFGFGVAKLLNFNSAIQKTFAIELGIQNGALAIVIAGNFLNSTEMAVPTALYSPVMITLAVLFLVHAGIQPKRNAVEAETLGA